MNNPLRRGGWSIWGQTKFTQAMNEPLKKSTSDLAVSFDDIFGNSIYFDVKNLELGNNCHHRLIINCFHFIIVQILLMSSNHWLCFILQCYSKNYFLHFYFVYWFIEDNQIYFIVECLKSARRH